MGSVITCHLQQKLIALQASVLDIWSRDLSKVEDAQQMAAALAAVNGAAAKGEWDGQHPTILASSQSLHENFRGWNGPTPQV